MMIEVGLVLLAALLGGVFRRWFGGGFFSAPRLGRVLVGVTLGVGVAFTIHPHPSGDWHILAPLFDPRTWWPIAAGLIAGLGWVPGHGSYMDMGTATQRDNEFLRQPLDLIFGSDALIASTRRDFTGMSLRYLMVTVPLGGAAVVLGGSAVGWLIMPGGILVTGSYLLAWRALSYSPRLHPTVVGEYAAGAIIYGSVALVGVAT